MRSSSHASTDKALAPVHNSNTLTVGINKRTHEVSRSKRVEEVRSRTERAKRVTSSIQHVRTTREPLVPATPLALRLPAASPVTPTCPASPARPVSLRRSPRQASLRWSPRMAPRPAPRDFDEGAIAEDEPPLPPVSVIRRSPTKRPPLEVNLSINLNNGVRLSMLLCSLRRNAADVEL